MSLNFKDREKTLLDRELWLSREERSRMTVITGGPMSGKTTVAIEQAKEAKVLVGEKHISPDFVYMRLGSRNDNLQVREFKEEAERALGIYVPESADTVASVFSILMDQAIRRPFSLIIDGIENAMKTGRRWPELFKMIAKRWNDSRDISNMNLTLICGTAGYGRIFEDPDSPLYGLPDTRIRMETYTIDELSDLMRSRFPEVTKRQILEVWAMSEGIPEYVEAATDIADPKEKSFLEIRDIRASRYLRLAEDRLKAILGRNSGQYLSILQLIAGGENSLPEIEKALGDVKVGGHIAKLIGEYKLIERERPVLDDGRGRNMVRYRITDPAIGFWLRFIEAHSLAAARGDTAWLNRKIASDKEFMENALRRAMVRKLRDTGKWDMAGEQWDGRKRNTAKKQEERLIVAMSGKDATVAASRMDAAEFEKEPFLKEVESLGKGPLKGYRTEAILFTLEDF